MSEKTLLIVRACDADPAGSHIETRAEFDHPPNGTELQALHARAVPRVLRARTGTLRHRPPTLHRRERRHRGVTSMNLNQSNRSYARNERNLSMSEAVISR